MEERLNMVDAYSIRYNKVIKVSKGAKIRNQYNQVPHLTQDTNGKVTNLQWYTKNKSQEASPFLVGEIKDLNKQRHNQRYKQTFKKKNPLNNAI